MLHGRAGGAGPQKRREGMQRVPGRVSIRGGPVVMTGRRAHERYCLPQQAEGVLQVLRQVVTARGAGEELTVFSKAPAAVGELMGLEVAGGGRRVSLRVRVLESRPILLNGIVQHRVRCQVCERRERAEPAVALDSPDSGARA